MRSKMTSEMELESCEPCCEHELQLGSYLQLNDQTEDESSNVCGVLDVVVFFVGGEAITPPTRCSGRGKVKNTKRESEP